MKYKKSAALVLALMLALRAAAALASDGGIDWKELASHFSAFSGMFYWLYSTVSELTARLKEMEIFDVLSLLLRSGVLEDLLDLLAEPDTHGAVSI